MGEELAKFNWTISPFILLHHVDNDVLPLGLKVHSPDASNAEHRLSILLWPRHLGIVVHIERIRDNLGVVIQAIGDVVFQLLAILIGHEQHFACVAVPPSIVLQSISRNEEKRTGALKINCVGHFISDTRVSNLDLVWVIAKRN